ncbi:MAG TPA: hypothetical protein VM821_02700 [Abditibacteriaceae bacterium]|nr:hypothetical protein [Abditibacteriaceae bacterium]
MSYLAILLLGAGFYFVMPFSKKGQAMVIDSATSADGSSFILNQKYEGGFEYNVSFYVKSRSKTWREYYIDHDSSYWHSGRVVVDDSKGKASIWRGKTLIAVYNWKNEVFYDVSKPRIFSPLT